jgi:poly-gamma-glutamate synthesis protein (capsule biosynthesis protein)
LAGIDGVVLANNHVLDYEEEALLEMLERISDFGLRISQFALPNSPDLVIFSIHWGPNMLERPSPLFREFARAVMEAGADVYHGHSAHLFQGLELYRGKPIIYDAGDFVDDYEVDAKLRNDQGLLFRLHVEEKALKRVELIPTLIANCQVNLATGSTWQVIAERICALSAEMGTMVHKKEEHLWIECGAPLAAAESGNE